MEVQLDGVYAPSEDVVGREVVGEFIIVPLTTGIGDMEDELYTLNETGREIWNRLDGNCTLEEVAVSLAEEYQADLGEIEQDVLGLVAELVNRSILVEISDG